MVFEHPAPVAPGHFRWSDSDASSIPSAADQRIGERVSPGDRYAQLAAFKAWKYLEASGAESTIKAALLMPGTAFNLGRPEDQ